MEKIRRKIKYTGMNLNAIFWLPCVKSIVKFDNEPVVVLWRNMVRNESILVVGSALVEYDNGEWEVQQ